MSTERDELADELADSIFRYTGVTTSSSKSMADELLAAGYRKPRQVTTVEELDALPIGAMVLDAHGDVARRYRGGWRTMVSETDSDPWLTVPLEDATLPATVLHVGGVA